MAGDFILVDNTKAGAAQAILLKNAISIGRQFYQQMTSIRQIMTHMNDGTDFTAIETFFGLPAGDGQLVFNLVNGSVGVIEGTFQNNNIKTLTEQLS